MTKQHETLQMILITSTLYNILIICVQEGDLKITQSMAIVRHLARKFNLVGKTEAESARADMITDQLGDYRSVCTQ